MIQTLKMNIDSHTTILLNEMKGNFVKFISHICCILRLNQQKKKKKQFYGHSTAQSHKTFEREKQDFWSICGEVRISFSVMFSWIYQNINTLALAASSKHISSKYVMTQNANLKIRCNG